MVKLRVYELAKELGVENKLVISKATELGIAGVKSHSNSLQPDDADQIRRAFIRQAIGARPEKETVKTSVNKDTGESHTIVERRKGNVIRRRKRSGEEAAEEAARAQEAQEAAAAAAAAESEEALEAKPSTEETLHPDDLFKDPEPKAEEPEEEAAAPAEEAAEAEEVQAKEAEPVEEEKPKEEPKAGPRVLGKIELPQKPAPKPAKKKAGTKQYVVDEGEDEDSDGRDRRGRKKRSKKREFSRTDLVDYEGKPVRRTGKGGKGDRKGADLVVDPDDIGSGSPEITVPKASKRVVKMDESISVGDLANQMSLKAADVISKLIELGVMATINQAIDQDTAAIIAEEFEFTIESTSFDEGEILEEEEVDPEKLVVRPPVVTVMGHVDHGKTSLLDAIRETSVVDKEHGGITQHIGAYSVELEDGRTVSFIDTPGHAAFTSMRARGAHVTDIVILVVAADDGVMPQTLEAIDHAKAAEVPIVVAVNKMDKQDANPDKVKQQLAERGLQPEDWGGDTMFFHVSALQKQGLTDLLEGILLQAEVKELKATPDKRARGTIIEARQDKGRGTVATVLIQDGTLKVGDVYVTGGEYGRVRSMTNYLGESLDSAGPSIPVEITGLSGVPEAGDDFVVVNTEAKAKQVASHRAETKRKKEALALAGGPISLEEFARQAREAEAAQLNIIVKADVHGSLEAVKETAINQSVDKVKVSVIHGGVGAVSESDVQLAIASKALIVGFNVRAEPRAMAEAETHGVEVRFYRVIYELMDDIRDAMAGLLDPIKQEKVLGRAEIRDTFSVPKIGKVGGCYITDGMAKRGSQVRLLRDNAVIYEGKMGSLRRFKDDVKEVQSGYECGISIDGFNDLKVGDIMELYEYEHIAATLE